MFNVNQGELHVASAQQFSIPFAANVVEYDDPIIPYEFNLLMERYWPEIGSAMSTPSFDPKFGITNGLGGNTPRLNAFGSYLRYNYTGIPYIESVPKKGLRLVFKYKPKVVGPNGFEVDASEQDLLNYAKYGPIEDAVDEIVTLKNQQYSAQSAKDYAISQQLEWLEANYNKYMSSNDIVRI
jgi:hypothetical protein